MAADVMAQMFAETFQCCPHGDIELAFVQWMTRALSQGSSAVSDPARTVRNLHV